MAESKGEIVKKAVVKREAGYLYFVNKDGDVCRVKMKRRQKKKEEKKEAD